ncbi:proteasome subunit alpha [Arthrobacter sp. TES]|uniref:Proteasome subunit alpha n=1 Tax=Paenarthrobacter ureafaciens TaxID=37931 RepID=A0AAX3EET8_PAEUR|nr:MULTISPECIES: proteasome subunit alpha [Paenarthrobacter]AMB40632.1 proteasome subunit alpha [Arthrobacter sp. ATCC 21022]AOY71347.1 proteasome subunit alpha [Arthrobacter sp. ZXY-2]ERI39496.1 proteasome subunit alpha [Arthrobacter sp. AK-YN10]NKR11731.1 proteasome subunit alpha [Arthrobacter sp. M5]NKR15795.1 proteasome subunit alpha [Arthrobacter sp. M6]OEH63422.1 proteasome subunit alpha [Arthrobacter sp. D2]OEH65237.1 proteasome subunit alpha [Arthrobacter sp. D4]QOI63218.1 proteasom
MTQQFYVSPEQLMKDRADFARKGIARGRSVIVISCADGIALVAENPSPSLHKIGEIYDKIAFAAVGKYNEFESLRQAGVRYADVRGYSYDREDVTARGLASVYAQSLGAVFTAEQKPFEVELAVAEVGPRQELDHLYRLTFDGSIADENGFVVMGGVADQISDVVKDTWDAGLDFPGALRLALRALAADKDVDALPPTAVEAAVLERASESSRGTRRAFRRLLPEDLAQLLVEEA